MADQQVALHHQMLSTSIACFYIHGEVELPFVAFLIINSFVLLLALPNAVAKDSYCHYFNEKYAYSIDYPCSLTPQREPDAHDGQVFLSKSSPMNLRVWGAFSNWSGEERSISLEMQDAVKNLANDELPQPKLTYKTLGKNFFVLSGMSKQKIFYIKTIKGNGVFATMMLTYPASQKKTLDAAVKRIAGSLKV